jgi:hypothetical protein
MDDKYVVFFLCSLAALLLWMAVNGFRNDPHQTAKAIVFYATSSSLAAGGGIALLLYAAKRVFS